VLLMSRNQKCYALKHAHTKRARCRVLVMRRNIPSDHARSRSHRSAGGVALVLVRSSAGGHEAQRPLVEGWSHLQGVSMHCLGWWWVLNGDR
jgi:hypothetical protein